jgi:hypothetical protein
MPLKVVTDSSLPYERHESLRPFSGRDPDYVFSIRSVPALLAHFLWSRLNLGCPTFVHSLNGLFEHKRQGALGEC